MSTTTTKTTTIQTTTTDTDVNTTDADTVLLPAQARGEGTSTHSSEARVAALLDAGAVLPAGTTGREDADALTARTYTHTALGDRPVVRLVPGTLGEAEDLALEFLGLARTDETHVVGQVRRETLGFPAWALVNDPANGHHALALVKDIERLGRQARSRAGALTVKALRQYVRDLVARLAPANAWAQFRRLLVERCAAGMPPYAALPQDVRALVKAAGLDRESAERELVADLIGSPGIVRAPASFWTAYRPALVTLARREPSVRARLLGFFPETFSESGRVTEAEHDWLVLLADSGAEDLLTALPATSASSAVSDPSVSPADWIGRWEAHRRRNRATSGRSRQTLDLVARMADRLHADGRPVELFQGRWQRTADLDLLDLCLASGIPVAEPDDTDTGARQGHGVPLGSWLTDTEPGARDL